MSVTQEPFTEGTPPAAAPGAPAPGGGGGGGGGGNVIGKARAFIASFQNAATEERRVAMDIVIKGVQAVLQSGGGGPGAAGAAPQAAGPPTAVPTGPGPQQAPGRPARPARQPLL